MSDSITLQRIRQVHTLERVTSEVVRTYFNFHTPTTYLSKNIMKYWTFITHMIEMIKKKSLWNRQAYGR